MKKQILLLFMLLSIGQLSQISAQQKIDVVDYSFEKGELSEIKDKNRFYLVTYKPYQSANILKSLKKYSDVQAAADIKEAEYIIVFDVERMAFSKTSPSITGAPPSTEDAKYFGHLYVYTPSKTAKNRIVWEMRQRYLDSPRIDIVKQEETWYEPLEKSLIGNFINDLKKLRGEK